MVVFEVQTTQLQFTNICEFSHYNLQAAVFKVRMSFYPRPILFQGSAFRKSIGFGSSQGKGKGTLILLRVLHLLQWEGNVTNRLCLLIVEPFVAILSHKLCCKFREVQRISRESTHTYFSRIYSQIVENIEHQIQGFIKILLLLLLLVFDCSLTLEYLTRTK